MLLGLHTSAPQFVSNGVVLIPLPMFSNSLRPDLGPWNSRFFDFASWLIRSTSTLLPEIPFLKASPYSLIYDIIQPIPFSAKYAIRLSPKFLPDLQNNSIPDLTFWSTRFFQPRLHLQSELYTLTMKCIETKYYSHKLRDALRSDFILRARISAQLRPEFLNSDLPSTLARSDPASCVPLAGPKFTAWARVPATTPRVLGHCEQFLNVDIFEGYTFVYEITSWCLRKKNILQEHRSVRKGRMRDEESNQFLLFYLWNILGGFFNSPVLITVINIPDEIT